MNARLHSGSSRVHGSLIRQLIACRWVVENVKAVYVLLIIAAVMAGCASTPEMSPVQTPSITNAKIDDAIRRPVPVYEFPESEAGTGSDAELSQGEPAEREQLQSPGYSNESTTTSRTVLALLDQASKQENMGRPERAAAALERALRIEPKNPRLWHRLAVIRFEQGQYVQAESLAAKSSALAAGDWHLKQKNSEIIQQVQQRRGYLR